jgi:hypothetical protein
MRTRAAMVPLMMALVPPCTSSASWHTTCSGRDSVLWHCGPHFLSIHRILSAFKQATALAPQAP